MRLAFEQFREVRGGKQYVRIAYYAQTLDEMRRRAPLNYRDPPGMMQVSLPACSAESVENACPLETFLKIVKAARRAGVRLGHHRQLLTVGNQAFAAERVMASPSGAGLDQGEMKQANAMFFRHRRAPCRRPMPAMTRARPE